MYTSVVKSILLGCDENILTLKRIANYGICRVFNTDSLQQEKFMAIISWCAYNTLKVGESGSMLPMFISETASNTTNSLVCLPWCVTY